MVFYFFIFSVVYFGFDLLFEDEAFDLLDNGGFEEGGLKLF
jgi:hypothetical protein